MTPHTIPQAVLFPDLFDKPLVATFNQEHASSDGGAVLLKAAERVYGLVKAFARCLADKRAPGKIRHTLADLIGQRVFGIACGHPDGNDADHLADDPIHKLLLGRDPVSGAPLASQPTISRFENGARRTVLYRMGRELAACVIERHRRRLHGRARRITIDLDPTDDLTHGAQQLTFFNGHYGGWCYLPMLGFLSFDREAEQYLCAAVLRLGKAVAADGTLGLLSRLLPLLRAAFPRARFLVRLDGGFATPEIFDFLDAEPRLDYVADFAEVDHRFRGCGSRISVKWSAHRSVATFVGQLPPIGVVASGRYPTRAVVSVSIDEVACGSCGRRVRRPRCCGKRAFGDGAVAAERIARVFHGTARVHRLFAPGGSVGRLADVIVMSSPSGGWRVRRACVASSGP